MPDEQKAFIPPKRVNTDYPVSCTIPEWHNPLTKRQIIDTDPYVLFHTHEDQPASSLSSFTDTLLQIATGDEHTDMQDKKIGYMELVWLPSDQPSCSPPNDTLHPSPAKALLGPLSD